jgi:hypothetical protein
MGGRMGLPILLLSTKPVESLALALQGVDHVHGGHGLAAGVLGVGDAVPDHVLQKDLEHPPGLLVDEAGDALHPAPAGQAADGRLGDPLDVVPEHLPVALRTALPQSLASLSAA